MHDLISRLRMQEKESGCWVQIENTVLPDHCSTSLSKPRDAEHLPSWWHLQTALHNHSKFLYYSPTSPFLAMVNCSAALINGKGAPSSEFVSSSIPSWQILTAHDQPFRGARDLAFCLKVPLDSLLVWASSEGSGETAWMRRLAWTFAARIGDKYQIRLTRTKETISQEIVQDAKHTGEP